jgi:general secretion pathway protein A
VLIAEAPAAMAAPVTPVAAPAPTLMDAADALSQYPTDTGTDAAFVSLFALWGAQYGHGAGRACDQAIEQGLECVFQKGSWGLLRSLNRPAILQLSDDQGVAHQAVVAAVDEVSARLILGGQEQKVSLASLSRYWNGDFLLLWRPKVTGQRALTVGMHGNEIYWLRSSLARVSGQSMPPKSIMCSMVCRRNGSFQRASSQCRWSRGLQTQIAIDAAVTSDGSPTLVVVSSTPGLMAGNPT